MTHRFTNDTTKWSNDIILGSYKKQYNVEVIFNSTHPFKNIEYSKIVLFIIIQDGTKFPICRKTFLLTSGAQSGKVKICC